MKLHNLIINYDLKHHNQRSSYNEIDDDVLEYIQAHPCNIVDALGNNLGEPVLVITRNQYLMLKRIGEAVLSKVKDKLFRVGLSRP